MEGSFAVPFHFAVEFLVFMVAAGGALDAVRARRRGAGVWSLGQALGFLALCAAQVAHGALIFQADGDRIVLGLRAAAFLLIAVSARPATVPATIAQARLEAAAAGTPAFFVAGLNAGWAIAPAMAAFLAGVRGVRAHRRDQDPATFAFAAGFFAFATSEALTAVSPPAGGGTLVAGHVTRALAALFLARWLWSSIVRSVRMRFVAAFVVVLTILVLVVSTALNLVISNTLRDEEIKRLTEAGRVRVEALDDVGDNVADGVRTIARTSFARSIVEDPDRLVALVQVGLVSNSADFIMLIDGRGRVQRSVVNDPDRPVSLTTSQEIPLAGSAVVTEALDGRASVSPLTVRYPLKQGSVRTEVVVLAAAPIPRTRAVLAVGSGIGESYLRLVQRSVDAPIVAVFVSDRVASTTFAEPAKLETAFRALRGELGESAEFRRPGGGSVEIAGRDHLAVFVPLETADDQLLGMFVLARPTADALAGAQRSMTRTLFLITLAAVIVATTLAWLSGGRITRPIRSLTAAARELRRGHLEARASVAASDEVGTLGNAFNEMAQGLQRMTDDLRGAAEQEASLRARMEAILQSMGDGLIAIDEAGRVVTFNRAAEQMLGRRSERMLGKRIGEVVHGQAANGRSLADVALTGGVTDGILVAADGRQVPIAFTAAPLLDSAGNVSGRVVVFRDVSREHEAERMKSEFLSNVSHELRTPITPIKGYAEIMRRKKFSRDKTERFLEGILESTERLERIVEILVDFAAIEAGRLKPRTDPVPVAPLLDDVATRWRRRDGAHTFVRKGGRGLPPILGDEKLIQRSLDELMDNAVKFSPEGGRIEVLAEAAADGPRARKPRKIRITIRDQGIGIEEERLPDLFQDFRQLDGSETRSYGGLGLGLAYVKRVAGVHGGEVIVDSKPGKGSSFSLVLPAADATGGGRAKPRAVEAEMKKKKPRSGPVRPATKRRPAVAARKGRVR